MASRGFAAAVLKLAAAAALLAGALVGCRTQSPATSSPAASSPVASSPVASHASLAETVEPSVGDSTPSQPDDGETPATQPTQTDAQLVDLTGPTTGYSFDVEDWRGYLQFYAAPDASADLVGFHEPGARAIKTTGEGATDATGLAWREVVLTAGLTGWLPADVAVPTAGAQIDFAAMPCRTDGIAAGEVVLGGDAPANAQQSAGPQPNRGIAIAQMWQVRGPACDRIALVFAEGDYSPTGELLTVVPGQVTLSANDSSARLRIDGVSQARFAADYDLGRFDDSVAAVTGRTPDDEVVVELFAPRSSTFALTALADPARVLIDVARAASAESQAAGEPRFGEPRFGEPVPAAIANASVTLIVDPTDGATLTADGTIVVDELPATLRGYARWFEANGSAQLATADLEAVTGRVTGPSVWTEPVGDSWGLTVNDYVDAPGSFTFTLEEAPVQASWLFVGSCGENDPTLELPNYRMVPGGRYCNYNGVVVAVEVRS